MYTVLFKLKKNWVFISSFFRRSYTANKCGHETKSRGLVIAGNRTNIMEMDLEENGNPDYCLDCISKMSIQCAWCGEPITIGNPVTLYTPVKTYEIPEYALLYTEEGSKALVGCLGWDCAETGGDRAGFWLPGNDGRGRVKRVPTAFETLV